MVKKHKFLELEEVEVFDDLLASARGIDAGNDTQIKKLGTLIRQSEMAEMITAEQRVYIYDAFIDSHKQQ